MMKSGTIMKDNSTLKCIGIVIVVLLCMSIFVDVLSFKRLSLLFKTPDVDPVSRHGKRPVNLAQSINEVFR